MRFAEIRSQIASSIAVKQLALANEKLIGQIEKLAATRIICSQSEREIIFTGNGGSIADAQHLSAKFISRFIIDRALLATIVLGAIGAIGNDYSLECIPSQETSRTQVSHIIIGFFAV